MIHKLFEIELTDREVEFFVFLGVSRNFEIVSTNGYFYIFQRSLSNTEDECSHLKKMCENSQKELEELAEKHQKSLQDMTDLQTKLQVGDTKFISKYLLYV